MRRYINMTCRKALALLVLAAMLLLPVTPALAAAALDNGLDAVDIAADGTVTLISGHMAGEGVASVQLVLEGVGEASFTFDTGLQGSITKAIPHDDGLHIYVAGAGPLMGLGVNSIVLGKLTSVADTAKLKEGSLQYVYGKTVLMQNVTNEYSIDPDDETGTSAYSELEKLVNQADAIGEGQKENYTDASWAALLTALDNAKQLLDQVPSEEAADHVAELEAAYELLEDALEQLTPAGKGKLIEALEHAQSRLATIDRTKYTPESIAALEAAVAHAIEVRDNKQSTQTDWDAAVAALEAAVLVEVPQQTDDPGGGGGSGDGGDSGGGGSGGDSGSGGGTTDPVQTDTTESTAEPTATPTATAAAKTAPNTGDETLIVPWLALLALCGGMLVLLTARRRQER